jgi:hypothetical protein
MEPVRTWTKRVAVMVVAVVALLATCSGFIDAVEWIIRTFGATSSGMAATFVAGWILATATAEVRARRGAFRAIRAGETFHRQRTD